MNFNHMPTAELEDLKKKYVGRRCQYKYDYRGKSLYKPGKIGSIFENSHGDLTVEIDNFDTDEATYRPFNEVRVDGAN